MKSILLSALILCGAPELLLLEVFERREHFPHSVSAMSGSGAERRHEMAHPAAAAAGIRHFTSGESQPDPVAAKPRAQDQTVRLGTLAPEGSSWYNILRGMEEEWKKGTGGRVQLKIFPGGSMGDEPDMVRKMKVGHLAAAALTGVGLSEIAPELFGLQLPMLLQNYEELDHVLGKLAPKCEEYLKAKGYVVLNWGDAGWVTFFAKQPVVSLADLRKRKLFVWAGNTVEVEVWKKSGVTVVPLAATEIHPSLQSGLIDALSTTPLAALSFQWFGQASHMTEFRWAPLIGATVMTDKAWKKVPDDLKPALLKAAKESGERFKKETRKLGDEAAAVMKKHGLTVHAVPADVQAEWEKTARAAWPDIMGTKVPKDFVAEIEKLRDEFRAAQKKP